MRLFKVPPPPEQDYVRPAGRKLFFFLIRENIWTLLELNLLTVLLCLPVITAPIALAMCTECCLRLVEDKPCRIRYGLKDAFQKHRGPALRYGLFGVLLPAALLALCDIYALDGTLRWQGTACLAALLFIWMTGLYAYPMLCRVDLPVRTIISNSFRLMLMKALKCFGCALLQAALLAAAFLLLPLGILIALLVGVVPVVYLSVFICYPDIQKYIIAPYYGGGDAPEAD